MKILANLTEALSREPITAVLESLRFRVKNHSNWVRHQLALQRDAILERTARGVDYQEKPFQPYSTKGPFYLRPNFSSKEGRKGRRESTRRLRKRLGVGEVVEDGQAIRFDSYRAAKTAFGVARPNLRGFFARGTHMLDEMKVDKDRLVISGSAAPRASGHNEGTSRLPKRRFLDFSEKDVDRISKALLDHVTTGIVNRRGR